MRKKKFLREEFYCAGRLRSCPVYDLHGHMGPVSGIHLPDCQVEAMVRGMKKAGVAKLIFSHHAALMAPDIGNQASEAAVRKYPDFFRAYLAFNPHYPEIFQQEISSWDNKIFAGLKFLADYHRVSVADERYKIAWEFAEVRKLPVLLHTWGGSSYDGPEQIRQVASRYPDCPMLLGHSCHGEWKKAISLVREFPNIYLELCAVLDERGILEQLVEAVGSERIVFGTDFPWFSYSYYIGAVLDARITEEERRRIFSENAERIMSGIKR